MSSRKEKPVAGREDQPNFDVNSFLKKTLSDFDSPNSEKKESGQIKSTIYSKSRDDHRHKINRNLLMTDWRVREKRLSSGDSDQCLDESCQLLEKVEGDKNVPSTQPVIDSNAVLQFSGAGKSRSKKLSPCPSRTSSATSLRPLCRICHLGGDSQGNGSEQLISPCRCSGTMQFVHTSCLVHWLEISTKKMCPSPHCELCGYDYKTHHCFRIQKLHMPRCSHRDIILHLVFVIVLIVMIGCAGLSIVYLQEDKGYRLRTSLNSNDIIVITCSILFFCSFFVAVFTQYRAEASLCRLLFRCWLINEHWRIKNYDQKEDEEFTRLHSNCSA